MAVAIGAAIGAAGAVSAAGPARSSSDPTPSVVVTSQVRQPIDGWGTSVVADDPEEPLLRPDLPAARLRQLDRLVFRDAGVNLVRVFSLGYESVQGRGRVGVPAADDVRFAFMRRARAYGARFVLTGADAPPEMLTVPAQIGVMLARALRAPGLALGKPLALGAERSYARYLARILRFAKERVGIPFDYVSIANEPENKAVLMTMTEGQAATVSAALAKIVKVERLGTRLILGDDVGWSTSVTYARAELAAPGVRAAAAAVASHAYYGTAADRRSLARLARRSGLPVWQTEWTHDCPGCPDFGAAAMGRALLLSERINEALVEANASAWFILRAVADSGHGATGALVVRRRGDSGEPFYPTKRFFVFKQYTHAAPPGSRRLDVTERQLPDSVLVVAFRRGRATSVILTNVGPSLQRVRLGLGEAKATMARYRTSPGENFRSLLPLAYDGEPVLVALPGMSVTSFTVA